MKLNEREYHVFISKLIFKMATAARISSLAAHKLDELFDGYCDIPEGEKLYDTDSLDNNGFANQILSGITDDYANYVRDLELNLVSRLAYRKIISEHKKALKELHRIRSVFGQQSKSTTLKAG